MRPRIAAGLSVTLVRTEKSPGVVFTQVHLCFMRFRLDDRLRTYSTRPLTALIDIRGDDAISFVNI